MVGGPSSGDRRGPAADQVRERVHATALRLGLILRTYVQSPDKRDDTRRVLNELLAEMRTARSPLVAPGQAPSGSVDAEIDRLISLIGALLVVLERLETLETAAAAEKRAEKKLEEVRRDWERLQEEMGALEARAERAEADRKTLEQKLRTAPATAGPGTDSGEHYRLKKEIDRLASSLDTGREERETLKKKLDAATKIATEYQGKMLAARKELVDEKAQMQKQTADQAADFQKQTSEQVADVTQNAKERYERRIALLEREKLDLEAAHAKERSEWAQARRRMEDEVAAAVGVKEALTRKLASSSPEVAEKASATEEIERLRARRRSPK